MIAPTHTFHGQFRKIPFIPFLSKSILWSHEISNLVQYFFLIVSNLQCIAVLFHIQYQITTEGHDSFSWVLKNIARVLILKDLFGFSVQDSTPTYIALVIILCYLVVFLVIFGLVVQSFWNGKNLSKGIEKVIIYTCYLHLKIGFWLLNMVLMENIAIIVLNKTIKSFFADQIVILVICSIFISLNYMLGLFFAFYSYDPFLTSNVLSSHTPSFQIVTFFFKGLLGPFITLLKDTSFKISIQVILSVVILLVRSYFLHRSFPFYHYSTMRNSLILSSIGLLISLANLVALIVKEFISIPATFITYTEIIIISLTVKPVIIQLQTVVMEYLGRHNKDLKFKEDVIKKLFSITFVMEKDILTANTKLNRKVNELRFWGAFSSSNQEKISNEKYNQTYQDDKTPNGFGIPPTLNKMCHYYTQCGEDMKRTLLQYAVEKFKAFPQFRALLAHFALSNNLSFLVASLCLDELRFQGHTKLMALNLSRKLQKKIDRFFYQNEGKVVNLKDFIRMEAAAENLTKSIQSIAKKYTSFWASYFKSHLKMKEFYQKSKEIELEANKIQAMWTNEVGDNKVLARSLCSMYSLYLTLIRGNPSRANKIFHRYCPQSFDQFDESENNKSILSEDSLMDPNIITFYASMTKDSPGKILQTSSNLTGLLGWEQKDLIDSSINIVLPAFMQHSHQRLLQNHIKEAFESGKPSRLYKTIEAFALHKAGHVLSCEVYISIHPYVQETTMYMVLLKVKKSQRELLLINKLGIIEGHTSQIRRILGLNSDRRKHLKSVCENYHKIEQIINDSNTKYSDKKELKNYLKNAFEDQSDLKSTIMQVTRIIKKNLKLNFFTCGENHSNRNKEIQTYSTQLVPQFFGDTFYFVLNLEKQCFDDNEQKDSGDGSGDLADNTSLDVVHEKEFSEGNGVYLPIFPTSLETPTVAVKPLQVVSFASAQQDIEKGLFSSHMIMSKDAETDLKSTKMQYRDLTKKKNSEDSDSKIEMQSLNIKKKKINLISSRLLFGKETGRLNHMKTQQSGFAKGQNNNVASVILSPPRFDGCFSPNGSTKPLIQTFSENGNNLAAFKNKVILTKKQDLDAMATLSVGTSIKSGGNKLEQAVHTIQKKPKILNALCFTLVLFIIIAGSPLIAFQFQNHSTLDLVESGIEAISKSIFRLARITDIGQYVRNVWQARIGLYRSDRYAYLGFSQDAGDILAAEIFHILEDLNKKNNDLRNFVSKLDTNLRNEIYQDKLPIYEMATNGSIVSIRTGNTFDIITELVSRGRHLVTSGLPFNQNNPDLLFILNNTFNHLLVSCQRTIPILMKDNESKLDNQIIFVYSSIISIAICGILVLVFLYGIQREFTKDRNHFIHIFTMLDEKSIQTEIVNVQQFLSLLEDSKSDTKTLVFKLNSDYLHSKSAYKTKGSKTFKKMVNIKGINSTLIIIFFIAMIFVMLIFSAYPVLFVCVNYESKAILTRMRLLSKSNINLYNTNFLLTTIYEYIQENAATHVRNEPIKDEWEKTFVEMTKVHDFLLLEVLSSENGLADDPKLHEIITSSLCDNIYTPNPNLAKICKTIGGGAVEKGLVGLNSYTLTSVKEVKDYFDNSKKTWDDMYSALSFEGLINIEIFYPFTYKAYIWIDNLIRYQILQKFNEFRKVVLGIVITYIVIYITLGGYLCQKIKNRLSDEMVAWRKMVRQIPYTIIVDSKLIRAYLARINYGTLRDMN